MSESILERSLDDIIDERKTERKQPARPRRERGGRDGGRERDGRRDGGRPPRGGDRRIGKPVRGGLQGSSHGSYGSRRGDRGDRGGEYRNDHRGGHFSAGSSLPRDILSLSGSRPVLRVKNIHPDLNGEDLSNLFGSISPVDFVKFDNKDDSVAYVCFQGDNIRSNSEAIAKYDGKKAMGENLVVENATSLVDRIISNPLTRRIESRPQETRGSGAQGGRGAGAARGAAKPRARERKAKPVKKDATALDQELEAYMSGEKASEPAESVAQSLDEPAYAPDDAMNLD